MSPEIERRLRAHVAAILGHARVPPDARDDLSEELFGHLAELWQAHVIDGLAEDEAAARAIAEFGTADRLGREFGFTYHSRLWASTIGVLVPVPTPISTRPRVVHWLRIFLAILAVLTAAALVSGLLVSTPLRAVLNTVALGIGLAGLILAFQTVARGQRWAVWFAGAVLATTVAWGVRQFVAPPKPNTVFINLLAIFAAVVLVGMYRARSELRTYLAASGRLSLPMAAALAISLLTPWLVPDALAAVADPTQASAADLTLPLSMRCDRGDVPRADAAPVVNVQRVTLVADMTWRHTDLLPGGLAGLLRPPADFGDTAGFRLVGSPPAWLLATDAVSIVDVETGATAGWYGAGSPSTAMIPDTIGSFTIGIAQSAIRAGHTIRAIWVLTPTSASAAWPRIEVAYAHLDRFLLTGTLGCGETTLGQPAWLPSPPSAPIAPRPEFVPSFGHQP